MSFSGSLLDNEGKDRWLTKLQPGLPLEKTMPQWRIEAKTKQSRHVVPMLVSDAIRSTQGWVVDVNLFGDLQFVVHFELAREQCTLLENALEKAGIRIYSNDWQVSEIAGDVSGAITVTLDDP